LLKEATGGRWREIRKKRTAQKGGNDKTEKSAREKPGEDLE